MPSEIVVAGFPEKDVICAPALVLKEPVSFWGGVSATDGRLLNQQFKAQNRYIGGMALFIRELRGSSSASSVLLELIYRRLAPAAIILDSPDAILALGVIVGREMGWPTPPILRLAAAEHESIPDGALVIITKNGELTVSTGDA
jgi:predicted aconitase with swiveling domain